MNELDMSCAIRLREERCDEEARQILIRLHQAHPDDPIETNQLAHDIQNNWYVVRK